MGTEATYFDLRARIQQAEWPVGSSIDGEQKLAETYGKSRTTIRSILHHLAVEGLLRSRPGKGWIVQTTTLPLPNRVQWSGNTDSGRLTSPNSVATVSKWKLDQFHGLGAWLADQKLEPRDVTIAQPVQCTVATIDSSSGHINAAIVADKLELQMNEEIIWLCRLRYAKGSVLALQWTIVPAALLAKRTILHTDLVPGGVSKVFKVNGLVRSHLRSEIELCTISDAGTAKLLQVERQTNLLKTTNVNSRRVKKSLEPFDLSITIYTKSSCLTFEWCDPSLLSAFSREEGTP
ncbi:MAG: GntR family transcriptional regulator, partial [Planctomycetaceae bacterium]|nr:GntR family transcriptional regulator [Planctomycetaceae bacterium]